MKNLFEVGEEVILVCKDYPEDNGEFTVVEKDFSNDFVNYGTTTPINEPPGWHYKLDNGDVCWYEESNLRKKHPPSELNFTDLMSSLTAPVKEKA